MGSAFSFKSTAILTAVKTDDIDTIAELDAIVGDIKLREGEIGFACGDETAAVEVGTVLTTYMPVNFVVTRVYASLNTAPTGSPVTIDILDGTPSPATSILSSDINLGIGVNYGETSAFADSPSADYTISKDTLLTIDITATDSNSVAAGLKLYLVGHRI
jgi:hypothetical protein